MAAAVPTVMNGSKGNDTYIVDNVGDSLFENFGEGFDTVLTSVSFNVGPLFRDRGSASHRNGERQPDRQPRQQSHHRQRR